MVIDDTYYREELLEHFRHPQNFKILTHPHAIASQANRSCGDQITLMVHVEEGKIKDIGFQGKGCAISMAFTSKLTETVKGMTVDEVLEKDLTFLQEFFPGQLSMGRIKCALLGLTTLQHALHRYQEQLNKEGDKQIR